MNPTARTLKLLRERGYPLSQVTERWNSFSRTRLDLFGFVDVLGVSSNLETHAFQVTSGSNVSARREKILKECTQQFTALKGAGWRIFIHGWVKRKIKRGGKAFRYELREIEL